MFKTHPSISIPLYGIQSTNHSILKSFWKQKRTLILHYIFKILPHLSLPSYGILAIELCQHITKLIWHGFHPLVIQSIGIFAVSRNSLTNAILFTSNSTWLLWEELWQVLPPFMMTPRTPRLMLFWTGYGIKRNRILYFAETLHSITILIADQVFSNGLDHKSIQYVALLKHGSRIRHLLGICNYPWITIELR